MRKTITLAAALCLPLAACGSAEEEATQPAPDDMMAEAEPVSEVQMAADGQPAEGTYEVTLADGSVLTEIVLADGTYTWTSSDGESGEGTWRTDGPNVWCTTDPGEEENCNDEQVGDDGVWTSVNRESGDTAVVVRVDS